MTLCFQNVSVTKNQYKTDEKRVTFSQCEWKEKYGEKGAIQPGTKGEDFRNGERNWAKVKGDIQNDLTI